MLSQYLSSAGALVAFLCKFAVAYYNYCKNWRSQGFDDRMKPSGLRSCTGRMWLFCLPRSARCHATRTVPNNNMCGAQFLRPEGIEDLLEFGKPLWDAAWKKHLDRAPSTAESSKASGIPVGRLPYSPIAKDSRYTITTRRRWHI